MHLAEYMKANGLTDDDVAKAIGRTRVSISRYRRRIERPGWETLDRIKDWSGGQVTDWPPPTLAECEAAE